MPEPVRLIEWLQLCKHNKHNEEIVVMLSGAAQTVLAMDKSELLIVPNGTKKREMDGERLVNRVFSLPVVDDLNAGSALHVKHFFLDEEFSPILLDPHEALIKFGIETLLRMPDDVTCCMEPVWRGEDKGCWFEWVIFH